MKQKYEDEYDIFIRLIPACRMPLNVAVNRSFQTFYKVCLRKYCINRMLSQNEIVRKKIVHKYIENPRVTLKSISKELKTTQATVSLILKKFLILNSIEDFKKY